MLSIYGYATASTESAAYIIGGNSEHNEGMSIIAEYRDNKWNRYGDMRTKRYRASAILLNGEHIIIGGSDGMDDYDSWAVAYKQW